MFFNTPTPKSGKHSVSSRADINLDRGTLNAKLRLEALARFTPVSITEELLKTLSVLSMVPSHSTAPYESAP